MSYVAIVTGASSGIGEATARRLAREPDIELILVARREDVLRRLAEEVGGASVLALDVTDGDAPERIRELVESQHGGQLHLLVNNAGAAWRGTFADTGWANVERHMKLNFEAPVRLTEAMLPLLRRTAQSARDGRRVAIVNVASTAARVARPNTGAYSASKFALVGWSDTLHLEEAANGIHVGLILPGFIRTPGFPAREIPKLMVSRPEVVAEAIMQAGPGGRAERYVPRPYWLAAAFRILAPALVRRSVAGGAFTTSTGGTEE